MKTTIQAWVILCFLALAGTAAAQEESEQQPTAYPPVPLADILDAVSNKTGRTFLTGPRVPAEIVVGQPGAKDLSYASLLVVLHNNGLAAFTIGDVTNIIHAATTRQHPVPIVIDDDDSIPDYEWVQRIVEVENGEATRFVPLLRPLIPQMGHLVAESNSNTLVLVGRYANTKRLIAIIREMDARSTPQP